MINTLQAETGTDITVDDDGLVGTVTIGAKDGAAVEEARRRIFLIVEPPEANVGEVYPGKVVNITKFGAFVNILPGRDGLLHISKLGAGRRVERVEDVLALGQDLRVRVDDIDPQGKVSLSLAEDLESRPAGANGGNGAADGSARGRAGSEGATATPAVTSFEEAFDAELANELGDLGPAPAVAADRQRSPRDRNDRPRARRPRRR